MGRPFPLETPEEPFSHRLIETFSLPTPTTAHSRVGQEPLICLTCLLTPTIRMMEQPCGRLPPPQGHPQRFLHQGRIDV